MDSRSSEARLEWNDRPIVRVEATVMTRGELGWTPHLGTGHSKVAIYENLIRTEYRLYAYRIRDKTITLDALIPGRMPFVKASAIFHHWKIGEQRMGLAFNGTADARSFDRGVRVALENLEKVAAFNMSCGSSTASDEPQSASPLSSPLPTILTDKFEDALKSKKHSTSSHTSNASGQLRQPSTPVSHVLAAPVVAIQQFRPQTHSASSSWQRPNATSSLRQQRRHSSSIPGRAQRTLFAAPQPFRESPTCVKEPSTPRLVQDQTISEADLKETKKDLDKSATLPHDVAPPSRRAVTPRRHRSRHGHDSVTNHSSRSRRTKTPNLDNLERQRDLQPTKPNSYVQIVSSNHTSSVRIRHHASSRTDEFFKYSTSLYTPPRSGGGKDVSCLKYDDAAYEQHGKSLLYPTSPTFTSYTDPKVLLKHPTLLKHPLDYDEKRSGKDKEDLSERSRCRHCQTMFNHDRNKPGACRQAPPDSCEMLIERISCIPCARATQRRCVSDPDDEYLDEPCSCSRHNGRRSSPWRRWLPLTLLSVVVPCLCLYPLLKSCHTCGVWCRCCGGRHEVITQPRNSPCPSGARR